MDKPRTTPATDAERRRKHVKAHKLAAVYLSESVRFRLKAIRERLDWTIEQVVAKALDQFAEGLLEDARKAHPRRPERGDKGLGRTGPAGSASRPRTKPKSAAAVSEQTPDSGTKKHRKVATEQDAGTRQQIVRGGRQRRGKKADMTTPDLFFRPLRDEE